MPTDEKGMEMEIYQLKLSIYFFNIIIYGDLSQDDDLQNILYWEEDLTKFGYPGTIMLGKTLSSMLVAANFTESDDPEMLAKVEVVVDENAARRVDAFFEKVMPIGTEGLSINQVAESDSLPIVNDEEVYIPVPWGGRSTIQLLAPDGFDRSPKGNLVAQSLQVVVSPELPQS